MTLIYNRLRRKLLPRHWLGKKRDANNFLGEFVLSASNQVLAVIHLCEVGLEWPARVLLRTVKELLNIGIVLVSDPATMKKYLALHPINDKKDWYQHFSRGKVSSNLADLNRAFGLPEKDIAT